MRWIAEKNCPIHCVRLDAEALGEFEVGVVLILLPTLRIVDDGKLLAALLANAHPVNAELYFSDRLLKIVPIVLAHFVTNAYLAERGFVGDIISVEFIADKF